MLDAVKSFFSNKMVEPADRLGPESGEADKGGEHPEIQIAACALLLELAYADDEFAPEERRLLEDVIQRHFAADAATARDLIRIANEQRQQAVDLFQFTSLIAREYDDAQKMVLLEAMWGLVFADGVVAKHEQSLMRRVSKLLDVRPGFLAQARRRAAAPD